MTLENKYAKEPFAFYPEGPSASDALFRSGLIEKGSLIYDPACGCGSIHRMALRNGFQAQNSDIRAGWDFLANQSVAPTLKHQPCVVVTNPPYGPLDPAKPKGPRIEEAFIEHAMDLGAAEVWILMPLPWMGARVPWLTTAGCTEVHVLRPRLSVLPFSEMKAGRWPGGGGKDYAWYRFAPQGRDAPKLFAMQRDVTLDTRENWTWWDQ